MRSRRGEPHGSFSTRLFQLSPGHSYFFIAVFPSIPLHTNLNSYLFLYTYIFPNPSSWSDCSRSSINLTWYHFFENLIHLLLLLMRYNPSAFFKHYQSCLKKILPFNNKLKKYYLPLIADLPYFAVSNFHVLKKIQGKINVSKILM